MIQKMCCHNARGGITKQIEKEVIEKEVIEKYKKSNSSGEELPLHFMFEILEIAVFFTK
ncbi:hypothetical protein [Methanolapillus ohkumae]|uniref:Uncharacterized protein n=1 Tax=Methanolapillus ohkumae TaxID=3028298 RepID=A0AA96V7L8_9EURY|nr:hypothetical protein MsAm2_11170 [Methanosarcinaceae archaeon Am2]